MKKRLLHTQAGPTEFELDLAAGQVEIVTEEREHAEVLLEPMRLGDQVAEDLISRTQHGTDGSTHRVRVPHPEPAGISATTGNVTVINSSMITGNAQVTSAGAVRVHARLPHGSAVQATTTSADVTTHSGLREVRFRSTSGDLDVIGAEQVRAGTVSGGVHIGGSERVRVNTTSGDLIASEVGFLDVRSVSGNVDVYRLMGPVADVDSTSGNTDLHAVLDAEVNARSVSGDIRVTASEGARVQVSARSVSGRVRTPEQGDPLPRIA